MSIILTIVVIMGMDILMRIFLDRPSYHKAWIAILVVATALSFFIGAWVTALFGIAMTLWEIRMLAKEGSSA